MNLYDFDAEVNYKSGAFNKHYRTRLAGRVKRIVKQNLPNPVADSFSHGRYYTAIVTKPLCLYRVFGRYKGEYFTDEQGNARVVGSFANGAFVTTEFAESRIDAKIRLALEPAWLNSHAYEAKIIVPKGTILNIGKVAPVTTKGGTFLSGGADQILLPRYWSENIIVGYRYITVTQLRNPPEYSIKNIPSFDIKSTVYPLTCPKCGKTDIRLLSQDERVDYIGSKGNKYTTRHICLNPKCNCNW